MHAHAPIFESGAAEADLNRFLASHRVLAIERQLVTDGVRSAWAICVSYAEGPASASAGASASAVAPAKTGKSVDYRDVLSAEQFQVFARLRALRKDLAEREGVPAYALFTNEQLAAMVRSRARTASDLARIDGVGKARLEKYGGAFLAALAEALGGGAAVAGDRDAADDASRGEDAA